MLMVICGLEGVSDHALLSKADLPPRSHPPPQFTTTPPFSSSSSSSYAKSCFLEIPLPLPPPSSCSSCSSSSSVPFDLTRFLAPPAGSRFQGNEESICSIGPEAFPCPFDWSLKFSITMMFFCFLRSGGAFNLRNYLTSKT